MMPILCGCRPAGRIDRAPKGAPRDCPTGGVARVTFTLRRAFHVANVALHGVVTMVTGCPSCCGLDNVTGRSICTQLRQAVVMTTDLPGQPDGHTEEASVELPNRHRVCAS